MTNQRAAVAAAPASGQAQRSGLQARRKRECHCEAPSTGTHCSACGGVVVQRHAAGGAAGDDPMEREADRAADAVTGGARVGRIGGLFTGLPRVQRSAVYTRSPVGSSGRIQKGPLVDWDYVVYQDHVRLGNRVFDRKTKQVIGTWPWLTNNPGDITVDPKEAGKARSNLNRAYEWGAVPQKAASTGHIPLAIFPDGKTGAEALRKLYQEPDYRDKTLKGAIEVHLGNPESRVAGVDNPKDYLDRVKERARKLGVKEELLEKTLAELAAAGAMDAIIEGFGYAEGYENVGITYTLEGRDKTDDKKIPQTVRNLRLFRILPDKAPDEILRLLGGKVPSNDGKAQKKEAHEEDDHDDAASLQDHADESVARALRSPSEPLPVAVRRTMEARFGHDFGRVRIHTDGTARASARQLGAHAYTVGRDIVFAHGQYAPQTHAGQRLLAHELTHVVQQTNPGPAGPQAAVEAEAHAAGHDVAQGMSASPVQAASPTAVHRADSNDGEPDGEVQKIAKENGTVAVVIISGGKIAKGLIEIRPPKGVTAQEAAGQIQVSRGGSKIDVVLPPGWGPQATNPQAKGVRLIDTAQQEWELRQAKVQERIDKLRSEYQEYLEEILGSGALPMEAHRESLDSILAQEGFLKWRHARYAKRHQENFARQSRDMLGFDDPEFNLEGWKALESGALAFQFKKGLEFQALKYDTVRALQDNEYGKPRLLGWMASEPQPQTVDAPDGSRTKQYQVPLDDGSFATISEADFAKLKQVAWDKVETDLNRVLTQKGHYQYQRDNRSWAGRGLDFFYGAELEGKTYESVDEAVGDGKAALKRGDMQAALKSLSAAARSESVARREYENYLGARETGGGVTIVGFEVIKGAADLTLAVGTGSLGGVGLLIATGRGVGETVIVAGISDATGEHVNWNDVAFDAGTQVAASVALHGVNKLGPNSAVMNSIRSVINKPVTGDIAQSVVMDAAIHAVKMEYEAAKGRGEHWSPEAAQKRLTEFITNPNLLARDLVTAAAARHYGPKLAARVPPRGESGKPGTRPPHEEAAPGKAQDESAGQPQAPELAPDMPAEAGPARPQGTDAAPAKPEAAASEPRVRIEVGVPEGLPGAQSRKPAGQADAESGAAAKGGEPAADAQGPKYPPPVEAQQLREAARDAGKIRPVEDPTHIKDYDYEISVESNGERHTWRRKKDGSWCRFSKVQCGFTLPAEDAAAIEKVAPKGEEAAASKATPKANDEAVLPKDSPRAAEDTSAPKATAEDAVAPPRTSAKPAARKGRTPLDVKDQLAAARRVEAATKNIAEHMEGIEKANRTAEEARKELEQLGEQRPPLPPSLKKDMDRLFRLESIDERIGVVWELHAASMKDSAEQRHLDWRLRALELQAKEASAVETSKALANARAYEMTQQGNAVQDLRESSKDVMDFMRSNGPNYQDKGNINVDQVMSRTSWEAMAGSRPPLATDHLVSLDRISKLSELNSLLVLYAEAPPHLKEPIRAELKALGDMPENLVRMRAAPNSAMKSNKSWNDITYDQAKAHGYDVADVDAMRLKEGKALDSIKQRIADLHKRFSVEMNKPRERGAAPDTPAKADGETVPPRSHL